MLVCVCVCNLGALGGSLLELSGFGYPKPYSNYIKATILILLCPIVSGSLASFLCALWCRT